MPQFTGATAKLALIEPKVFTDYVVQQQTETNRLLSSGVLVSDPIIQNQLLQGGTYLTIPNLNPLDGDVQNWNDTTDIKVAATTSYEATAPKIYQTKSFGYTDFGVLTTGAPVDAQIASQFSQYWNKKDNELIIAVLKNTFLHDDLKTAKGFGLASPKALAAGDFLAAISRMGDVANPQLTKIIVNSAVIMAMREQNIIESVQPATGGAPINYYNGLELVADDAIELKDDGTTDAYIVSNGAIAYGLASPTNAYEVNRDSLGNGGQTVVVNRRVLAMQVKGTSFTDVTHVNELNLSSEGTSSFYKPVGDVRNIGVVDYRFKVDTKFVVGGVNTKKKNKPVVKNTSPSSTSPSPSSRG